MNKFFMEMQFSNPCLLSLPLINVDWEILWKSQSTVMNGFIYLVSVSNNENLHLKLSLKCVKANCTMGILLKSTEGSLLGASWNTLQKRNKGQRHTTEFLISVRYHGCWKARRHPPLGSDRSFGIS